MPVISVRVDHLDDDLIRYYTKMKSVSLSQFIRDAVIDKIETEIDLQMFYSMAKQTHDTYSLKELQERLDIYDV